ncbi:MAG: hypothetical protein NZ570_04625 [Candidatus Caldarchaeum sp.]|nr:hypothetical protein [Candidatus Caldarchaeum sp.]
MDVFQLGIAVKPSTLDGDEIGTLTKLAATMTEHGYYFLVIDSETAKQDISVNAYERLLECSDRSLCTPVLTIPVRRGDFYERFEDFLEVVSGAGRGGVCLVAGNPAYLDEEERKNHAASMIIKAAEAVRRRAGNCILMVGTERMTKTAVKASYLYGASPLILLSPTTFDEIKKYDTCRGVYTPFYLGASMPAEVLQRLQGYVARRASGLRFEEAVDHFCLKGGLEEVSNRLAVIQTKGADLLVGYPLNLNTNQIELLAKASTF